MRTLMIEDDFISLLQAVRTIAGLHDRIEARWACSMWVSLSALVAFMTVD